MHSFRIVKYDPRHAGRSDEWTSVYDVGRAKGDVTLTRDEYLRVEQLHVDAVLALHAGAGSPALRIEGVEDRSRCAIAWINDVGEFAPREGAVVEPDGLGAAVKTCLRELAWCRLVAPTFFVHFGYDYYLYAGAAVVSASWSDDVQRSGLFVTEMPSPYQHEH